MHVYIACVCLCVFWMCMREVFVLGLSTWVTFWRIEKMEVSRTQNYALELLTTEGVLLSET